MFCGVDDEREEVGGEYRLSRDSSETEYLRALPHLTVEELYHYLPLFDPLQDPQIGDWVLITPMRRSALFDPLVAMWEGCEGEVGEASSPIRVSCCPEGRPLACHPNTPPPPRCTRPFPHRYTLAEYFSVIPPPPIGDTTTHGADAKQGEGPVRVVPSNGDVVEDEPIKENEEEKGRETKRSEELFSSSKGLSAGYPGKKGRFSFHGSQPHLAGISFLEEREEKNSNAEWEGVGDAMGRWTSTGTWVEVIPEEERHSPVWTEKETREGVPIASSSLGNGFLASSPSLHAFFFSGSSMRGGEETRCHTFPTAGSSAEEGRSIEEGGGGGERRNGRHSPTSPTLAFSSFVSEKKSWALPGDVGGQVGFGVSGKRGDAAFLSIRPGTGESGEGYKAESKRRTRSTKRRAFSSPPPPSYFSSGASRGPSGCITAPSSSPCSGRTPSPAAAGALFAPLSLMIRALTKRKRRSRGGAGGGGGGGKGEEDRMPLPRTSALLYLHVRLGILTSTPPMEFGGGTVASPREGQKDKRLPAGPPQEGSHGRSGTTSFSFSSRDGSLRNEVWTFLAPSRPGGYMRRVWVWFPPACTVTQREFPTALLREEEKIDPLPSSLLDPLKRKPTEGGEYCGWSVEAERKEFDALSKEDFERAGMAQLERLAAASWKTWVEGQRRGWEETTRKVAPTSSDEEEKGRDSSSLGKPESGGGMGVALEVTREGEMEKGCPTGCRPAGASSVVDPSLLNVTKEMGTAPSPSLGVLPTRREKGVFIAPPFPFTCLFRRIHLSCMDSNHSLPMVEHGRKNKRDESGQGQIQRMIEGER